MNNESSPVDSRVQNADQQAVADYFASETYAARAGGRGGAVASTKVAAVAWPGGWNDRIRLMQEGFNPAASFWLGIVGLGTLVFLCGALVPVCMEAVRRTITTQPSFVALVLVFYVIVVPPVITFSFATVTPMFWFGSVMFRFCAGIVSVIPGCVAFCVGLATLNRGPPPDFWVDFSAVMFAQFLAAGAVALTIQMWSRWTLSHARSPDTPLPPLGTRAMMELTGLAAIGFAVFVSLDKFEITEGLLLFTLAGMLSSLAVISVLIGLLRGERRSPLAAGLAGLFAFATAFLFAGFFAVDEFGVASIGSNLVLISALSLVGGTIALAVMWVCVWWLRVCGWRCVSRQEEKLARELSEAKHRAFI
jgi:hypothetical protein